MGAHALTALKGLTSLTYGNNDPTRVDAVWAIVQLTRLRCLELRDTSTFSDAHLAHLSALSRLTSLRIIGDEPVTRQLRIARVTVLPAKLLQPQDARVVALPMPSPAPLARHCC